MKPERHIIITVSGNGNLTDSELEDLADELSRMAEMQGLDLTFVDAETIVSGKRKQYGFRAMTKKDLIEKLEPFDDDVIVILVDDTAFREEVLR